MLEQTDGTYQESESDSWPTNMRFNNEKSGCMDANGNMLNSVLTYDSSTNTATVKTNGATYCYLYFDIMPTLSELCTNGDNLGSCLTTNNSEIESLNDSVEGGLYRYQGTQDTVNDNYICFGTTDKSECTSNTDAYMYRIIGVNESGQLKLIKKEALNYTQQWNANPMTDTSWPNSLIYSNITGSYYLENSTYMPSGWSSKIAETTWHYGNIKDVLYYSYNDPDTLYETEMGFSNTVSSKVSLMYLYDYFYATQEDNSWLLLSNNDSEPSSTNEWTMSYFGYYNSYYYAMQASSGADVMITTGNTMRPVFYLTADEVYISGNGSIDNPIIISEPELTASETIKEMQTTGLNTNLEGGLYRYQGTTANNYICFGTSDKSTCTGNTDAYMYRIIGINESGQLKLIKNEALGSTMQWYTDYTTDITWPNSIIYSNINGSTFLTNTTYVPSGWSDKIATTTWKYGDTTSVNYTASALYDIENAWTNTTSAKIGLMYAHDYFYAYQSGGLNCSGSGSYSTCKTAWMFLGICDSGAPSTVEWTMSRYGQSGSNYLAWYVNSSGGVYTYFLYNPYSVRPVFFLESSVEYVSGSGTLDDPFLIS